MTKDKLLELEKLMSSCPQTSTQSVLQHGRSVFFYYCLLDGYLRGQKKLDGWLVPQWLEKYKRRFIPLLPMQLDMYYYLTYHDCGKPFCKIVDTEDKVHFPDHAKMSAKIWKDIGGSDLQCRLMSMDMDIHTLKSNGISEFSSRSEAPALLLAGLAEIHSNASMFGGVESTSFKIKFKQIDRRGNVICKILFAGLG